MASLRPWYVLGVMLLAYVCSFVDRTIINLLVTPIKADLRISDTQISLLQGMAFAFFYVTVGLFISRLADQYSRRNIIAIGMVLWCMATAGGGFAGSFAMLLIFRICVAVGESALTPSATSMLNDIFPAKRLGIAMSLYAGGPYIGSALALILGGSLLDYLLTQPQIVVPLLGEFRPWQAAFLIVGLPGLLIAALLLLTVSEPRRRENSQLNTPAYSGVEFRYFARYVRDHIDIYARIFFGTAMLSLVGYGFTAWLPTYYVRTFALSNTEIGGLLGTSLLIGGPLGIICGGMVGDWLKKKRADAPIILALWAAAGSLVFGAAVVLVDSAEWSILLIIPAYFFKGLPTGMIYVAIHSVTPSHMRAQIVALLLFVDAIIGLGFGPTAIALFTDYVYRDEAKLGLSLLSTITIALVAAYIAFYSVRRPYLKLIGGRVP